MNKLLLTLGTVLLISGCSKEPTQLEKCVAVHYEKLFEGIFIWKNGDNRREVLRQPLVANEELANTFWKEYSKVYGGQTKADFEANKITYSFYNPDLSLMSFLVLYPNFLEDRVSDIYNADLWWSKEPTITELRTNMRAGRMYTSEMSTSVIWPLVVYWRAMEEHSLSYYYETHPLYKERYKEVILLAVTETNKEANKVCNSQGIY